MKKLVLLLMILSANPLWALSFIGPTSSVIKQGQASLTAEFINCETDIRIEGYGISGTLKDIETDLYLGRFGYSLFDGGEIFFRFGACEIENLGNEFAWGLGTRTSSKISDDLFLGGTFQFINIKADESANFGGYLLTGEYDAYEFQVAFGPTLKKDKISIYGGPLLHFITGDAKLNSFLIYDLEQESELGGYAGLSMEFDKNSSINFEYQFTNDAKAVGVGMIFKFGSTSPDISKSKRTKEIPLSEKIDPNRKFVGYRIETDSYGRRTKVPVYEEEQKK